MGEPRRKSPLWVTLAEMITFAGASVILAGLCIQWVANYLEPVNVARDQREQINLVLSYTSLLPALVFAGVSCYMGRSVQGILAYLAIPVLWVFAWATSGTLVEPANYKQMAMFSDLNSTAFMVMAALQLEGARSLLLTLVGFCLLPLFARVVGWDPGMDLGWSVALASAAPVLLGLLCRTKGLGIVPFFLLVTYGLIQAPAYSAYGLIQPPFGAENVDLVPALSVKDGVLYLAGGFKVAIVFVLGLWLLPKSKVAANGA